MGGVGHLDTEWMDEFMTFCDALNFRRTVCATERRYGSRNSPWLWRPTRQRLWSLLRSSFLVWNMPASLPDTPGSSPDTIRMKHAQIQITSISALTRRTVS